MQDALYKTATHFILGLTPFLDSMESSIGQGLGTAAVQQIQNLLRLMAPYFLKHPASLQSAAQNPENPEAIAALEAHVQHILEQNREIRSELERICNRRPPTETPPSQTINSQNIGIIAHTATHITQTFN